MTVRVEQGDCRELVPARTGIVDAIVTDPPYHLVPTLKRFGAATSAPAQHGRDGAMSRLSGGFMGQQWDGGDVAFDPATWDRLGTTLRPGGFLLAFGGTRTYHRMACAIEDAGFVIQDCIMWLYGSGFPKRRDALKPAYEPIVMAYKPGGARTLQIDECRIGTSKDVPASPKRVGASTHTVSLPGGKITDSGFDPNVGRWPANVCHDGSDEVIDAFPESAGQQGDIRGTEPSATGDNGIYGHYDRMGFGARGDAGSAARFFYSSKADAQDRWGSRHPTVKPVELMKWLVALVTPPDGLVLDPFAGSGTTGIAALATGRNAILIEREDTYVADIRERLSHYQGEGRHSLVSKARHRADDVGIGPLFRP